MTRVNDTNISIDEQLYSMKLNDMISFGWDITRVPGGWIYSQGNGSSSVFVPYDNEFQPSHIGSAF